MSAFTQASAISFTPPGHLNSAEFSCGLRGEQWEVVDGFKRLAAARTLAWPTLQVRRLEVEDERTVKAALYGLNQVGRHLQELEEAWLVQALVREDGLTQSEAAELLGRHKSWACRRLAMLEKLASRDCRSGGSPGCCTCRDIR